MISPLRFGSITIDYDNRMIQITKDPEGQLSMISTQFKHHTDSQPTPDDVADAEQVLFSNSENWVLLHSLMRAIRISIDRGQLNVALPEPNYEKKVRISELLQRVIDTTPKRKFEVDEDQHRTFKSMSIGPIEA